WDGAIAGRSQVLSANRIIGAVDDVPVAITRTPNCHVCFTVAVEISGYRHVVIGRKSGSPDNVRYLVVAALQDGPSSVRAAPENQIGYTIAVIVGANIFPRFYRQRVVATSRAPAGIADVDDKIKGALFGRHSRQHAVRGEAYSTR